MIALIENFLLALTDTQFDQVLVMIETGFRAVGAAVRTVWDMISPVVGLYLAWKCQQIIANQKSNREKLDETADELKANTEISKEAFVAANGHNEKIAAVVEYVKPKLSTE
jgi:hypothetical protein